MAEKINTIGKDFTMKELVKFVASPVISGFFTSLLSTLDDSLFLSRYCSPNALAAFTVAMPWFMFTDAVGMTLSAAATKSSILMGEKKDEEAKDVFTTISLIAVLIGLIFTITLSLFRKNILVFLGETEVLLPYALTYMNVSRFWAPLMMLSYIFSRYYTVAGKPKMGVIRTVTCTVLNFFFDWLFIVRLNYGIVGTAYANLISHIVETIIGFVFFANRKHEIHFTRLVKKPFRLLKDVVKIGRSQGITSLAISVNSYINNNVILSFGNEIYMTATTIANNVQWMFMNAFFSMVGSISPIASYAFGEKNAKKLTKTFRQALLLVVILSSIIMGLYALGKEPILSLYLKDNTKGELADLVRYGMTVATFVFVIFGVNVLVQEMCTAVNNNRACTFLSVLENVVFSNICSILIPKIFGVVGIWYPFLVSECLTLIFTIIVVIFNKDVYGYGRSGIASFTDI